MDSPTTPERQAQELLKQQYTEALAMLVEQLCAISDQIAEPIIQKYSIGKSIGNSFTLNGEYLEDDRESDADIQKLLKEHLEKQDHRYCQRLDEIEKEESAAVAKCIWFIIMWLMCIFCWPLYFAETRWQEACDEREEKRRKAKTARLREDRARFRKLVSELEFNSD